MAKDKIPVSTTEGVEEGGDTIVEGQDSSESHSLVIVESPETQVDITRRGRRGGTGKMRGLKEPYKPGQSGNPNGRPKKAQSITAQLEVEAKRKVTVTLGGKKYRGANMEILAKRMFEKAISKVEPRLCADIIDRVDGKPVSSMELLGKNGEPVRIVVQYDGNERT